MASKSILRADAVLLKDLYITPSNGSNYPEAKTMLLSDGKGGTYWSSLSTFTNPSYNSFQTDTVTYIASNVINQIKIKSGSGIGQVEGDPANQTLTLFSKAFQGISVGDKNVNAFYNNYLSPILNFSTTFGSGIDIIPLQDQTTILFSLSTSQSVTGSSTNQIFISTINGLGTIGYLSSISWDYRLIALSSSVGPGLSSISSIIIPNITRIVDNCIISTITGLGTFGYQSSLANSINVSTNISLGLSSVYIDIVSTIIPSTVASLGSLGYFSDIRGYSNTSSILGPAISTVFSTLSTSYGVFTNLVFPSTITGLGSLGYTSTLSDFSSIRTSTIRFEDYTTKQTHRLFTSSSRLYFNSTIVTGTPTLNLERFIL